MKISQTETATPATVCTPCYRIAYIASDGLGDGVVQILICQNLIKLGHKVTYYQPFIEQLSTLVSSVPVKPTSEINEAKLAEVDWIFIDKGSKAFDTIRRSSFLWARP